MAKHRQRTFRKSRNTGRHTKRSRKMRKRSKRVRKTRKRGKRVSNKSKHTIQKGGSFLQDYQMVLKCVQTLAGHIHAVNSAQFSPDGKNIVSASWDNTVRVWSAATGECVQTLEEHSGGVFSAQYSPDGQKIVSASRDKTVRVWGDPTLICAKQLALACGLHTRLGSGSLLEDLVPDIFSKIAKIII